MQHRTLRRAATTMSCAAALCVLASCSSSIQSWEHRPIVEVIATLGPATRITGYPYGGTLYIWESQLAPLEPPPSSDPWPAAARANSSGAAIRRQIFLVDDHGIVVATKHEYVAESLQRR